MRSILLIFLIGIAAFSACGDDPFLPEVEGQAWVQTYPIQCLNNPWEADWINSNPGSEYPAGDHRDGELSDEEVGIIRSYYLRSGIAIYNAKAKSLDTAVCEACDCIEGYVLYLQIDEEDVSLMTALGYTAVEEENSL